MLSSTVMMKNKNIGKTILPSKAILPFKEAEEKKSALPADSFSGSVSALREGIFAVGFLKTCLLKESTFLYLRFALKISVFSKQPHRPHTAAAGGEQCFISLNTPIHTKTYISFTVPDIHLHDIHSPKV